MEAGRRRWEWRYGRAQLLAWLLAALQLGSSEAYEGKRAKIEDFAKDWFMAGTAITAPTSLILTPGVPGRVGEIWRLSPVPSNDFEMLLNFRAKRPEKRSTENDGFALWYVEENASDALQNMTKGHAHNQEEIIAGTWGHAFLTQGFDLSGYRSMYKGLGIFFSESQNSSVTALVNDGSKQVKWGADIPNAEAMKFDFAGGTSERGLGADVRIRVRVQPKEVVVEAENKGIIKLQASLAAGGYIGISTFSGSLEPKVHEAAERSMRFEIQDLEISNKDPNAKPAEKEVQAVPQAEARKSDEISEDVLRESSSFKEHRAESDAIKDLTNMVFKLVVETQPMRTQMLQAIETLGKRISTMEKNFAELKAEIDKKSGHKLSEEFSAIKRELSSLSSVAATATQERHKKLETLHSDIADVHKSAHSPDVIDKHLDKLSQSNSKVLDKLTSEHRMMFGVSIAAIAFIVIAGLALYNKFRCWEKRHVL
uniref:L-type lectin-like domain-containing protein n=1 Tax=Alexandrium catenella TaxID=2925 RepID=A0A7S1M1F5_ALECA